jgi:TonB family protein
VAGGLRAKLGRARGRTGVAAGLAIGLLLTGCEPRGLTPSEFEKVRIGIELYVAYDRGDCETVLPASDPHRLADWEVNEVRHSVELLHGFCLERQGRPDEARSVYRDLVREAPDSFAAQDARERLRILKIERNDPERAGWMRRANERADPAAPGRTPIERRPATYPPVPRVAGVEGFALVEFGVTPEGETEEPLIVDSSPPFVFDGATLRAVRRWTFEPDPGADATRRQAIRIMFKRLVAEGSEDFEGVGDETAAEGPG